MHASEPAFDRDDINMEPTDLDMGTKQDIVPRGALINLNDRLIMRFYHYGAQNTPLALAPSTQDSQVLVPM